MARRPQNRREGGVPPSRMLLALLVVVGVALLLWLVGLWGGGPLAGLVVS